MEDSNLNGGQIIIHNARILYGEDFELIRRLRKEFPEKTPFFLQPQSNRKWSMVLGMKLLRQALKAEQKNIRLSIQLHKIYGLR